MPRGARSGGLPGNAELAQDGGQVVVIARRDDLAAARLEQEAASELDLLVRRRDVAGPRAERLRVRAAKREDVGDVAIVATTRAAGTETTHEGTVRVTCPEWLAVELSRFRAHKPALMGTARRRR